MDLSVFSPAVVAAAPLAIGALLTWFMQSVAKPKGWSNRAVLGTVSVVAAIAYTLFRTVLPPETQISVIQFLASVFGAAVAVHQYLVRPIKGE